MLTKSMFLDDGIIKLLIAYYHDPSRYLVQQHNIRISTDNHFRDGWESGW